MIPQKCLALQKLGGNGRAVIIYFGGSVQALVDKSLSSSMITDKFSRLKSMESSIASTNIQTSQLPDFCPSCQCHMRLANACRFSFFFPWRRLDGTELEFILFPSKREPNPSFPVLVLNNPIFTEASDDMLVCFWSAPFTETVLTAAEEA